MGTTPVLVVCEIFQLFVFSVSLQDERLLATKIMAKESIIFFIKRISISMYSIKKI